MALIASPLRGLLKNVALRSPYICPRCQLQAIKASRDSLQFQRRALRTRPHKQRQPVQPQQGYQDIETIARNRKGLVEDEDSYELEEGDEDGEMEHSGYRPGSEWRGLKTMKPSEWDAQAQYAGFNAKARRRDKQHVEWAIQCALVEIFTLKQNGHPVELVYRSPKTVLDSEKLAAKNVNFRKSAGGNIVLNFSDAETEDATVSSLLRKPVEMQVVKLDGPPPEEAEVEEYEVNEDQEEYDEVESSADYPKAEGTRPGGASRRLRPSAEALVEAQEAFGPLKSSWRNISLRDPALKFAVLKRTSQLLGQRIPDPQISSINTTTNLLDVLCKKPKPKKLVRELQHDPKLEGLQNLHIFGGRWSVVQKDDEKGLSKVIDRELRRKGLRGVRGHRLGDAIPNAR